MASEVPVSVRHIYVTESARGERTAHVLMRGARLQVLDWEQGKIYRIAVTSKLNGRRLFVALYNREGFGDACDLVYEVVGGSLKAPLES